MSSLPYLFRSSPSREALRSAFVGKSLLDDGISTPCAVVDRAIVRSNCNIMLSATQALGIPFRAHVKTHKCHEVTRLQVGENCKDVRLIASTLMEVEQLVPLLLDYKRNGAAINILYAMPFGKQQVARFVELGKSLGPDSVTAMIDHPLQLEPLQSFRDQAGFAPCVYLKADTGSHRAGLPPDSVEMRDLMTYTIELENQGLVSFTGIYSHAGHSYGGSSPSDAMSTLHMEIQACLSGLEKFHGDVFSDRRHKYPITVSVGASPTALSIENLTLESSTSTAEAPAARRLNLLLMQFPKQFNLELHAGVYPFLDMQQLAASSGPLTNFNSTPVPNSPHPPSTPIALTVLSTIHSLYPYPPRSTPQALTAAGTLALGREPCKSYSGWGVVSFWNLNLPASSRYNYIDPSKRMILTYISQEHGIIGWEHDQPQSQSHADLRRPQQTYVLDTRTQCLPLHYGQKIRIYPNHACIAASMYEYYLIVDSSKGNDADEIVDVWVRWRGW